MTLAAVSPLPAFAPLIARYRAAFVAAHGTEPALLDVDEAAGTFAMMRFDTKDCFSAPQIADMAVHLEWWAVKHKRDQGDER